MKTQYKLDFKEDPVIFEYILLINAGINTTKQLIRARKDSLYKERYKSKDWRDYEALRPPLYKYLNRRLFKNNLIKHDDKKQWTNKKRYVVNWREINQIMIDSLKERRLDEIEKMQEEFNGLAKHSEKARKEVNQIKQTAKLNNILLTTEKTMTDLNNSLIEPHKKDLDMMFNSMTNEKNSGNMLINKLNISLLSAFFKHCFTSKIYLNIGLMESLKLYMSELEFIEEMKFVKMKNGKIITLNGKPVWELIKREFDKYTIATFNLFVQVCSKSNARKISGFNMAVRNIHNEIMAKNDNNNRKSL